jgi:N-acetylmuramoyl-L-alanine amidase
MKLLLLLLTALLLTGCSSKEILIYDLPLEFRKPEKKKEFYSKYSPYLTGKKIFIDPGHGGEDRRNKGPLGIAVEADVNLKVSLALRDFLQEAGAVVYMSRESDITVPLKERSAAANRSGADIFVSIHHNAPGASGDEFINYTSTYYHAKETDYEYEPSERDIARFIQRDLAYAMRSSGGLGSFDGTYSDYWIYPGAGFSVLRLTEIPAVLVECSFFTHHYEERRLAEEEYNRLQAWGIFRGIARYFSASIPLITWLNEADSIFGGESDLTFLLSDSTGINAKSIIVQIDSVLVDDFNFDEESNLLSVNLNGKIPGEYSLRIIAANKNGNHSFPFHKKILVQ